MASIALRNIGSIDYLAYGSIFTRAMFRPQKKVDVFSRQISVDEPWEVVVGISWYQLVSVGISWYHSGQFGISWRRSEGH